MRCVFPACDRDDQNTSLGVGFYRFPEEVSLQSIWKKAICQTEWQPQPGSIICSEHFLVKDFLVNAMQCQNREQSQPIGSFQMCRICFATDCNMYSMTSCSDLNEAYEFLTGIVAADEEQLPRYVCAECADRLMNCARFRRRSLRAHAVLLDTARRHGRVTLEFVHSLMKTHNQFSHDSISNPNDGYCTFDNKESEELNKSTDGQCDVKQENVDISDNVVIKAEIDEIDHNSNNKNETVEVVVNYVKIENYDFDNQLDFNTGSSGIDTGDNVLADCLLSQEVRQEAKRETETSQDLNALKIDDQQPPEADGPSTDDTHGIQSRHYRHTHSEKLFVCEICKKELHSAKLLQSHLKKHTSAKTYSCDNCKKIFRYKSQFLEHVRLNYNVKLFSCDLCDRAYKYKSELQKHLMVHTDVTPYSCGICRKKFKCSSYLQVHMKLHTTNIVNSHSCYICQKTFKSHKNLQEHIKTHSDVKPHTCDVCKKSFKYKNSLTQHYIVHSSEKPYSCDVCKKSFKLNKTLQEHLKIHSDVKDFTCDVCKKTFTFKKDLLIHCKTHSDEKPYSCDICKRAFKLKKCVDAHMIVHSDDKPFTCDVCKKTFKSIRHVRSHLKTHSDVKPYSCGICNSAYRYKHLLRLHLKKQH